MAAGVVAQFVLYWVSLNTCHIFAVSSLALGRLSFLTYFLTYSSDVIKIVKSNSLLYTALLLTAGLLIYSNSYLHAKFHVR